MPKVPKQKKASGKSTRSHEENQERAYIAASRRSDRSLEARCHSALKASEIHKKRTGRGLNVSEDAVASEDMYEEVEDDPVTMQRRLNAHFLGQSLSQGARYSLNPGVNMNLNPRLREYLDTQAASRHMFMQQTYTPQSGYRHAPYAIPQRRQPQQQFPVQPVQQPLAQPQQAFASQQRLPFHPGMPAAQQGYVHMATPQQYAVRAPMQYQAPWQPQQTQQPQQQQQQHPYQPRPESRASRQQTEPQQYMVVAHQVPAHPAQGFPAAPPTPGTPYQLVRHLSSGPPTPNNVPVYPSCEMSHEMARGWSQNSNGPPRHFQQFPVKDETPPRMTPFNVPTPSSTTAYTPASSQHPWEQHPSWDNGRNANNGNDPLSMALPPNVQQFAGQMNIGPNNPTTAVFMQGSHNIPQPQQQLQQQRPQVYKQQAPIPESAPAPPAPAPVPAVEKHPSPVASSTHQPSPSRIQSLLALPSTPQTAPFVSTASNAPMAAVPMTEDALAVPSLTPDANSSTTDAHGEPVTPKAATTARETSTTTDNTHTVAIPDPLNDPLYGHFDQEEINNFFPEQWLTDDALLNEFTNINDFNDEPIAQGA